MSKSSQIMEYLDNLPAEGDWVPLDLDAATQKLSMTRPKLVSWLSAFQSQGKIELVKDGEQRTARVMGFRNLNWKAKRPRKRKEVTKPALAEVAALTKESQPQPIRRLVQTPELDRLFSARSAMSEFVSHFPGLVDEARAQAAIHVDPEKAEVYANEGMSLIERNQRLEVRNRELSARVTELERELGYKRLANNKQLREGLVSAGVVHSSD